MLFRSVLDVNDNAPKFAAPYEGFICESDHPKALSNQVRLASPALTISNEFKIELVYFNIQAVLPPSVHEISCVSPVFMRC